MLQEYVNQELKDVQAGFRKHIKLSMSVWITEKAREFQKNIYICFIDYAKTFMWITANSGKFLKEMGIPGHLICLLWHMCADQEATVRTGHGTTDWFQIGKEVRQGCILLPGLSNLYAEYIMRNARLDEAEVGIKIARRNISNLRYADDTTLITENEEELKNLLMKVKVESEKAGLKLSIQIMKIIASGPITSWHIDRKTMETVRDLISLGSEITVVSDCSHEIKGCLLLERKAMTNLGSILKSRDITLLTKVCVVKAMDWPTSSHLWMWELDHNKGWALKDWSFWTVVLEKTLESPLDCKEIQPVHPKGNQLWTFIGRTDAEAPTLWAPDAKSELIWKDPDAGRDWGQEEKRTTEDETVGWLVGITNSMDMSLTSSRRWWRTGRPGVLPSTRSQSHNNNNKASYTRILFPNQL